MNHLEQFLALLGDLAAVVCAVGWARSAIQGRRDYADGRDDGYDEALAELERRQVTAVLIEETAGLADTWLEIAEPPPVFEQVGHTIYPELAALAAEDVSRPEAARPEGALDGQAEPAAVGQWAAGPGHLESTQEWQARMDLEAAQWCARHGLRHESAWAA